jgi:hypothetical protein
MPEQVTFCILHPQITKVNADHKKGNRCLPFGPPLNRQRFDQNEAAPIEHFLQ